MKITLCEMFITLCHTSGKAFFLELLEVSYLAYKLGWPVTSALNY
jgi:hypothetical protein